ncbi:MAG: hypothetical protein B6I20_07525 [Bacteroidetes bacterium 4572_117]|nr:MAG: hypothetical protein B6I20_07525 [Bacteroidetes bacterium 4572_117]
MKKIIYSTLIAIFVFNSYSVKAQIDVEEFDNDQYVFWFYIKAEIKTDRELKRPVYKVRRIGKDVKSGTMRKYKKEVWRNTNSGQQLPIGPFLELGDAERANRMYDLARKTSEQMEKEIASTIDTTDNTYFWYPIQFTLSNRTRKILIKRQPARVAEGSLIDFRSFMWEVLMNKQLAIGPFTSKMEAEESKRLYRLEDSFGIGN